MIKAIHNIHRKKIEKSIRKNNIGFLLSNNSGGYYLSGIKSRFSGLFFNLNKRMFKIIDEIKVSGKIKEIHNNFHNIEIHRDNNIEKLFMPENSNTLVYEVNHFEHIDIILDIRESYDSRKWGKNYKISVEQKKIIIEFTKTSDARDGDNTDSEEYKIYLAIEGDKDLHYKEISEWINKKYDYDKSRGSSPFDMYVYNALKVLSKRLIFSVSFNKEEAIKNADKTLKNLKQIKEKQKKAISKDTLTGKIEKEEIKKAYECCIQSLDSLAIETENQLGIYAGLPWFFQFWARDEAISLKSLILLGKTKLAKKILLKQLKAVDFDGRIPNRIPSTKTGSADAVGWHFKRWFDLIYSISKEPKNLENHFTKTELKNIIKRLEISLSLFQKNHTHDGFAVNFHQETWMDSIERVGIRIETQALLLSSYKLLYKLTGDKKYLDFEEELRKKVREKFWDSKTLADGLGDRTIRPNIFIAAYIYPELLTKEEWKTCFKNSLPSLWLEWGGLSTIDKKSPYYEENYTGENPVSYHNGDSWYWINNLAAIVLHKIDKKEFKTYIKKILKTSTEEILWNGILGGHSELSSASSFKSEGSPVQAWSYAMYIELIHEIYIKEKKDSQKKLNHY